MNIDINDINSIIEWEKNRVLVQTILDDGRYLSTVRIIPLGINGEEFETMLFNNKDDMEEISCWRWKTEKEATEGHQGILDELRHEALVVEVAGLGVKDEQDD